MNFLKIIPNYIFFVVARRHYKKEGEDAFTGTLAVSFFFFWVEVTILYIVTGLLGFTLKDLPYPKAVPLVLIIGTFLVVRKVYKGKYPKFAQKWKQETLFQTVLGFIIITILCLIPLGISVLFQEYFKTQGIYN